MNKKYFIAVFKSGYIIPHYMIYCVGFIETADRLVIQIDDTTLKISDYDYYHVYEFENDSEIDLFVNNVTSLLKTLA